ncbi:helix-turn-helix domain-containing protein [Streptomyces atroolivaceus]|uniref:helix-turn-helix domain-containing protein n=1 Tax=Streptomyces atroolivaceus TaxID=66869 RepID=UPI00363E7936
MPHSGPSAVAITLSEAERAELLRRTEVPHRRSAEKARIILACAEDMSNAGVARLVGVQAKTVGKWRRAFAAERMAGLEDAGPPPAGPPHRDRLRTPPPLPPTAASSRPPPTAPAGRRCPVCRPPPTAYPAPPRAASRPAPVS